MLAVAVACLGASPPVGAAQPTLTGSWTAIKAERDGKAADDVVGHRLAFAGNTFKIDAKDGQRLYAGTVVKDARQKPASIDFRHRGGVLNGKTWKGIYVFDGGRLTICDNAPDLKKGRPTAFEAKTGSGYVLITFERTKP
jgi:uncharacterized protein (TIGR03067 family)